MVFLPKTLWDDLPLELANHISKTFRVGVPHEKDIFVIGDYGAHRLSGSGNWFAGNLTVRAPSK
jgi:hypothetical protein